MTPASLRKLAVLLDAKGAHKEALEARVRASDREAGEELPTDSGLSSLLVQVPVPARDGQYT